MTRLIRPANQNWHRGWIPGEHRGQDFGYGNGTQIYAAAPGTVTFVGEAGDWGNRIIIWHAPGVETTYNHIVDGGFYVAVGQDVPQGAFIATMGNTGYSFGTHLHFELYLNGTRVDPQPYYTQDLPGTSTQPAGGGLVPFDEEKEDTVKVYEDAGNVGGSPVNTGKFYIGAPGAWLLVNNHDFGGDRFVRELLTAKFGPILWTYTNELVGVKKTWLALAPKVV